MLEAREIKGFDKLTPEQQRLLARTNARHEGFWY